jgi:hypothetical protein
MFKRTDATKKIYFIFGTDGLTPELTCVTHPFKSFPIALEYAIGQIHLDNNCLEIDISDEPVDSIFHLIIENTEWNVKTNELESDERISVIYDTDTLESTFIFPENKLAHSFKLYTYQIPPSLQLKDPKLVDDYNLTCTRPLEWNYLKLKRGYSYRMTWDWETIKNQ